MKILGKLKKRKVKSEYVRPIVKMTCDKCGKELIKLYAHVYTDHQLWGNDSVESVEGYDLCFECAKQMFNEYLNDPVHTEHFDYECREVVIGEDIEMDEEGNIDLFKRHEYQLEDKGEQR